MWHEGGLRIWLGSLHGTQEVPSLKKPSMHAAGGVGRTAGLAVASALHALVSARIDHVPTHQASGAEVELRLQVVAGLAGSAFNGVAWRLAPFIDVRAFCGVFR